MPRGWRPGTIRPWDGRPAVVPDEWVRCSTPRMSRSTPAPMPRSRPSAPGVTASSGSRSPPPRSGRSSSTRRPASAASTTDRDRRHRVTHPGDDGPDDEPIRRRLGASSGPSRSLRCSRRSLAASRLGPAAAADPDRPVPAAATPRRSAGLCSWASTLLDTRYRLPSSYVPPGLTSTAKAGTNGGYRVRRLVIGDLRAMVTAARRAGVTRVTSGLPQLCDAAGPVPVLRQPAGPGQGRVASGSARALRAPAGDRARLRQSRRRLPVAASQCLAVWLRRVLPEGGALRSPATSYEPWHVRYVGGPGPKAIHASGLVPRAWLWVNVVGRAPDPLTCRTGRCGSRRARAGDPVDNAPDAPAGTRPGGALARGTGDRDRPTHGCAPKRRSRGPGPGLGPSPIPRCLDPVLPRPPARPEPRRPWHPRGASRSGRHWRPTRVRGSDGPACGEATGLMQGLDSGA